MIIDYEQAAERLDYNPDTGVFTRKMRTSNSVRIGEEAGNLRKDGYRQIRLCGKLYLTGRLAFLLTYKRWPDQEIDHINGNRSDDRISNLREVNRRQNNQNHQQHRNGKLLGSCLMTDQSRTKPWRSQIVVNGKHKCLGYFATEQAAHEAYMKALKEIA